MLNYGGLGLGLLFEARDLASGVMQNVERNLRSVSDAAGSAARRWDDSMRLMRTGLTGLGIGGSIAGSLALVGRAAFRAASEFEVYQMQFATMFGSLEKARAAMADLAKFAAVTPYEIPEIVQAGKLLTTFGMDYTRYLRDVGDLAAAFGGSGERLLEVVMALGRLKAGQFGEAFESFRRFGISYEDWEKAGLRFNEKNKQFLGTAEEAVAAFAKVVQLKGFSGMMEKLSKTTQGIISNIKDAWGSLIRGIGAGFLERAKDALRGVLNALNAIDPQRVGEAIGRGFRDLIVVLTPVFKLLMAIAGGIAKFVEARPKVASFIITLSGVSAVVLTIVSSILVLKGLLGLLPLWLGRVGLAGRITLASLLGPIFLVVSAIQLFRYAYERNLGGFAAFVNRVALLWRGVIALVASTRFSPKEGWKGFLPENLRNELKKAGLLDITVEIWMITVRIRSFLKGLSEGVKSAFEGIHEAIEPFGKIIKGALDVLIPILEKLGLDFTKAGASMPIEKFEAFGRAIGKVLVPLLGFGGVAKGMRLTRMVFSVGVEGVGRLAGAEKAVRGFVGGDLPTRIRMFGAEVKYLTMRLNEFQPERAFEGLRRVPGLFRGLVVKIPDYFRRFGENAKFAAVQVGQFSVALIRAAGRTAVFGAKLVWTGIKAFASFTAGLVKSAVAAITSFVPAISTATASAWSFAAALLANPVTWVVAGVIALGTALYFLIKNWDKVTGAVSRAWAGIWAFARGLSPVGTALLTVFLPFMGVPLLIIRNWDRIRGFFAGLSASIVRSGTVFLTWTFSLPGRMWGLFMGLPGRISSALTVAWGAVTGWMADIARSLSAWITGFPSQVGAGILSAWNVLIGSLPSLLRQVAAFFSSLPSQALEWGRNLIVSFVEGIKSALGAVGDIAKQVAGTVKRFLGIESPAKTGPLATSHLWGPNLVTMFAEGIRKGIPLITAASMELASVLAGGMAAEVPAPRLPEVAPIQLRMPAPEVPRLGPYGLYKVEPVWVRAAAPETGVRAGRPVPTVPLRPVITPRAEGEKKISVIPKQSEKPEIIQLVVDGRTLAEVVRRVEREDLARSAPW
ncbi:MAG TPA: hypothetical protein GXX51_05750 [Firmicutes bacterium]|nr:hypothetical protein [Bacillota bacterium]